MLLDGIAMLHDYPIISLYYDISIHVGYNGNAGKKTTIANVVSLLINIMPRDDYEL